jgi:hypothetical protein
MFVAEFKGGTYIAQVKAPSVDLAIDAWRTGDLIRVAELSETSKFV